MTIKEKLYKEFVIIKNKVNVLEGEPLIGGDDIEEYFKSEDFSYRALKHTKAEIKRMIESSTYNYERLVKKLRIEEYFNTEEGKVAKEKALSEINAITLEKDNLRQSINTDIDTFIKEWLGKEWGCGIVGSCSLTIGIVKEQSDDGINFFHFGHTFTIYYNDVFDKDRFELNYGAMGAFSLLGEEDKLRCEFLLGIAKFTNEKDKLIEFKTKFDNYCSKINEYNDRLVKIREYINNPFENDKI